MGVQAAANIKQGGTVIYTIGYDLDAGSGCTGAVQAAAEQRALERRQRPCECGHEAARPIDAIRAMATSPQHFYNKPNPG